MQNTEVTCPPHVERAGHESVENILDLDYGNIAADEFVSVADISPF